MEGDGPTAGSVLFQYSTILSMLTSMKKSTLHQALSDMITTMIVHLREYQKEALHCHPIVLATILNPKFRLEFFNNRYPEYSVRAEDLFRKTFSEYEEPESDIVNLNVEPDAQVSQDIDPFEETNVFAASSAVPLSSNEELEQYLSGKYPCEGDILSWWRVR